VSRPPRVAVVLGSGGARGYAHIGALDALAERGYDVVAIAGSSMGAIVGGVFATGKLDEYRDWVTGIGQFEMLRMIDISLSRPGLRSDRVFAKVRSLVGDVRIEDLPIDYTAVAVDLTARREVWFQRGPLEVAMRASGANPSLFPPVELDGRLLIDGGVLNPLPLAPTAASNVDLIVAISLHGESIPAAGSSAAPSDAAVTSDDDLPLIDRIRSRAARALDGDLRAVLRADTRDEADLLAAGRAATEERPPRHHGLSRFDLMQLSLETMQAALVEHKLAGYRPDVLVSVPKNACRSLDFHRATELIALGQTLTSDALDRMTAQRAEASRKNSTG
jgi:NTE family protein